MTFSAIASGETEEQRGQVLQDSIIRQDKQEQNGRPPSMTAGT